METVILLHGLYMTGSELVVLRNRLRHVHGFRTRVFKYRSVGAGLAENAERLHRFVEDSDGPQVHLLGHSLGGVVMLQMMKASPLSRPGRLICLGSPLRGSSLASHFLRAPMGVHLVGKSLQELALAPRLGAWPGDRDLGIIAGSLNLGLGAWLGAVTGPSDGTVSVEETRLPGAADHLVLPVCHISMLFSPRVADQAANFLRHGSFERDTTVAA